MSSFMRFSICATYCTLSWDYTEKLREQYAAELKKVTQLQKQWALRKPVLDAHCLALQKEILRLEQEIDTLVIEKIIKIGNTIKVPLVR